MNNSAKEKTFIDLSREIADKFIRDIVFIDEQAYPEKSNNTVESNVHNNEFDTKAVSDAFLKKGKICAIYAPQTEKDVDESVVSLLKADVVVLDWDLKLKGTSNYDPMADDESEKRGQYTKPLIKRLVDDSGKEKVKLIIIYTGETDVEKIAEDIHEYIQNKEYVLDNSALCVQNTNLKIIVRAKEGTKVVERHKDKIIRYNKLPELITEEFTTITNGILPNYALSAITAIRNNTSNILGVFSKDIDPAFLGQYVSIPDCNDAISMLPKIFGTAVTNLIETIGVDFDSWIEAWIDEKIKEGDTIINGKNININANKLKCLLKSYADFEEKFNTSFDIQEKKEKVNRYTADLYKIETIKLFCSENADASNYKWAKLVQHSNLFSSPKNHRLTTGTIIKYKAEDEDKWNFLICIQQNCDSVRIPADEGRTFLFLPLVQGIKGEAIVVGEQEHLIVDNKTYSIELHRFLPNENEANITTKFKDKNEYVFEDTDGKQFVWVAELKEMFAQHIVSAYASQLSRVGVDNSEWIRLVGKTK